MAHIVNALDYLSIVDPKKPIELRLNSPGGSVIDGLAIYDAIEHIAKKTPVNITVNGSCMSMATVVLQAGVVRRAYANSEFLLHEINYADGRSSLSTKRDLQETADRLQKKLNGILTSRSGLTEQVLQGLIDRRDYTITAHEAFEHGLIDSII